MTKRKSSSGAKGPRGARGGSKPRVVTPEVLEAEDPDSAEVADEGNDEDAEISEEEIESEARAAASSAAAARMPALDDDGQERGETETGREIVHQPMGDLLQRYLEEVRRHPLLTPEEEITLANRMREKGDMDAAKRLVQANLRLVVKIAMEYRSYYANLLDLVQEGNVGLMKAVSKFDPTKGARLGYYASWWIRSYILKYLLDNFRLVKIGKTQAQKKLFYHLLREKQRLEAQGLLAGPKLLAERLNVREKDVIDMEQRLSGRGQEMSLDSPVDREGEGGGALYVDQLADGEESADERMAREQLVRLLKARLPEFEKNLNEKERRLLNDRLLAEEPKTLQEVADNYGLTRERARQIEVKVIAKLREFLKPDL
ncbi:MAG TPA: RNA polymerase factor sigma-32 [Bdellovibrionota bacterium]|nr:RNA polymerase factor sigma-32 [Bdellovibrionota bacterium]